jgi:hypothetical protein
LNIIYSKWFKIHKLIIWYFMVHYFNTWVTQIRRFTCDTHPILKLAYRSILTTSIRPDTPDMSWYSRYAADTPPIRPWYFFKIFWWIRSRIRPRYSSICPDTPPIRPRVKFISCHLCCYNISVIYISIEYNNLFLTLFII